MIRSENSTVARDDFVFLPWPYGVLDRSLKGRMFSNISPSSTFSTAIVVPVTLLFYILVAQLLYLVISC